MHRLLLLATAAAFFTPIVSNADFNTEIAKCAAARPESSQLACYERLAKNSKVDAQRSDVVADAGKWRVSVDSSPIDDSKNAFLHLDAENSVQKRYGSAMPTLLLRCKERKLVGYIVYNDFFLGSDSTKVLTRFDKRPARTSSWQISSDHSAVFVGGGVVTFLKELLKSETLLVELTPYSESPVLATFDVRGIAQASTELRRLCPWK